MNGSPLLVTREEGGGGGGRGGGKQQSDEDGGDMPNLLLPQALEAPPARRLKTNCAKVLRFMRPTLCAANEEKGAGRKSQEHSARPFAKEQRRSCDEEP